MWPVYGRNMPTNIDSIVLAAGCSNRFGTTKLLARIGDESIIRRVVRSVSSSRVSSVYIVVGHDADRVRKETESLCNGIVVNADYEDGMGYSIAAGVKSLPAHSDAVIIVLGDQPLVSPNHINALIEAWSKTPEQAVLSGHKGTIYPPSLFPRSMFPKLETLRGDVGARSSLSAGEFEVVEFDNSRSLLDVDRPQDLEALFN